VPIGAWVLERACADMARVPAGVRVAVNCSPVQLESFDFASHVRKCLEHFGLSSDRLEIEVTESFLINDSPRIAAQLRRLKEMGVRISLDDFGTGYSSLNCLEQYPFDSVKIDRSFVQKLERREATRATVRAIIELASSFGMTTIAEGVETRAQLATVVELGCAEAQGFPVQQAHAARRGSRIGRARARGAAAPMRSARRLRLTGLSQSESGTERSPSARRLCRRAAWRRRLASWVSQCTREQPSARALAATASISRRPTPAARRPRRRTGPADSNSRRRPARAMDDPMARPIAAPSPSRARKPPIGSAPPVRRANVVSVVARVDGGAIEVEVAAPQRRPFARSAATRGTIVAGGVGVATLGCMLASAAGRRQLTLSR
jgi:EAL domain-containing protein (putative c-di-GMP-specific phosphodiesterase class I)